MDTEEKYKLSERCYAIISSSLKTLRLFDIITLEEKQQFENLLDNVIYGKFDRDKKGTFIFKQNEKGKVN